MSIWNPGLFEPWFASSAMCPYLRGEVAQEYVNEAQDGATDSILIASARNLRGGTSTVVGEVPSGSDQRRSLHIPAHTVRGDKALRNAGAG
jgi:hypothetical protein